MPRAKKQRLTRRADGRYRCAYQGRYFYGRTEDEALEAREAYKRAEKAGMLAALRGVTVREYAIDWLPLHKGHVTAKTYNAYAAHLERLFPIIGDKLISAVTVDDAARCWRQYENKSSGGIKIARSLFVGLFDTAIENDLCRKNPFRSRSAQPPKGTCGSHRSLTAEEIALVESVQHRLRPAAMVMLYAGLRKGEALALEMSDVDLVAGVIHVTKSLRWPTNRPVIVPPKTAAGVRDVPILSPLRPVLAARIGRIAESKRKRDLMTETAFTSAWESYLKALSEAAGHPVSIRPHDLRHTFCTMLRDAGVDIKQAMIWMGHADEKMILRVYDHVTDQRTKNSIGQVEKMLVKGQKEGQPETRTRETH